MAEAFDLWKWFPAQLSPPGPNRIGPPLASAGSPAGFLSPTHPVHHVTGTSAITNINPPDPAFQGSVTFIADAIWTWTAAGTDNSIGIAGTVTAAGKSVTFTYDPMTKRWYPDKVA